MHRTCMLSIHIHVYIYYYLVTQEYGKTLTRALCEGKTRAEKLSKGLDRVRELLSECADADRSLRSRVDEMLAIRTKQDRDTAEWRSMEKSMFVELDNSRRAEDQLRAALAREDVECALVERSAARDADEMRAEIARLTDDLAKRRATVDVLRARVDELETGHPSPQPPPQLCLADSDRRPRDRNQSPESRRSLDWDAEGAALVQRHGDADPRRPRSGDDDDDDDDYDDRASSSSTGDDFVTCDGKSTGDSLAAHYSVAPGHEIPLLEWLELTTNGNSKKPAADDDNDVLRDLPLA